MRYTNYERCCKTVAGARPWSQGPSGVKRPENKPLLLPTAKCYPDLCWKGPILCCSPFRIKPDLLKLEVLLDCQIASFLKVQFSHQAPEKMPMKHQTSG